MGYDGKEKIMQTLKIIFHYDGEDYRGLDSITIQGNFTNCIESTTEVNNYYERDIFSRDVVGLVGVPLEIETQSEFDKAEVSITYQALPSKTKAENLGVLWYNEKNNRFDRHYDKWRKRCF